MTPSLAIPHAKALSSLDKLNAIEAVIAECRMIDETRTMETVLRLRLKASLDHLSKTGVSLTEVSERTELGLAAIARHTNYESELALAQ